MKGEKRPGTKQLACILVGRVQWIKMNEDKRPGIV